MISTVSGSEQTVTEQTVTELQQRITRLHAPRLSDSALPTHAGLAPLVPGGALQRGASYSIRGSRLLALASVTEASTAGSWCGIIGLSDFGAEAAASLGVALDRCVLVPRPGAHALGVAAALAEVLSVVVLALPPHSKQARPAETARVAAKLREHGAALVATGPWPQATATLTVTNARWHGLGEGRGLLDSCELTVRSESHGRTRRHTARVANGALVDPGHAPVHRLVPRKYTGWRHDE